MHGSIRDPWIYISRASCLIEYGFSKIAFNRARGDRMRLNREIAVYDDDVASLNSLICEARRLLRPRCDWFGAFLSPPQTPDQYQTEYNSRRGAEYSRFHGYTYDGIWTVALAVKHVARRIRHYHRNQTISDFRYRDVLWEKLFLDALRNTSFDGVTVSWPPSCNFTSRRYSFSFMRKIQDYRVISFDVKSLALKTDISCYIQCVF